MSGGVGGSASGVGDTCSDLLQAATPIIIKFTIGISIKNTHHPGLLIFWNIFQYHISVNTKNVIADKDLTIVKGINTPIKRSQGHQCILDALNIVNKIPIPGIHASPGALNFAFLAIDVNARERYTYNAKPIIKKIIPNTANIPARAPTLISVAIFYHLFQ